MARKTASQELTLLDLEPLIPIRNETVLTRYPIHRLGKHGEGKSFEIREKSETDEGKFNLKWQVSYNSTYGEPGPLAYKVDTIVINRAIDEAREHGQVPAVIHIGSLSEIAREVGTGDNNTSAVKQALYQNAFAAIVATLDYNGRDGKRERQEFAGTRYSLFFRGQLLPDGSEAPNVCILLHDVYRHLLNTARIRPLDYEYLKMLSPGGQRLYELLSFEIYAALKRGHGSRAKLVYSEYCTHAPQKRYFEGRRMRMQMKELHAPHIASEYILDTVEYVDTHDDGGNVDWEIFYTPGRKAVHEYVHFNSKGGRKMAPLPELPTQNAATQEPTQLTLPEEAPALTEEQEKLVGELTARGLAKPRAYEAVREIALPILHQAVQHFDFKKAKGDKIRSAGALLADMIAHPDKYVTPEDMPDPAKEAARKEEKKAARTTEEQRVAALTERLQSLYALMRDEEPEAFAEFEAHGAAERDKFTRTPIFKGRKPEIQRVLLASYDTEKGKLRAFVEYFAQRPELSGIKEADMKRALDRIAE